MSLRGSQTAFRRFYSALLNPFLRGDIYCTCEFPALQMIEVPPLDVMG